MASLKDYEKKRDFKKTSEPQHKPLKKTSNTDLIFVVHEHHASHLHFDFRLEWEGVLKSWAVPKGIPLKPKEKRLAVEVEDHPIEYAAFSGTIPKGQYGAGEVFIWDHGTWEAIGDVKKSLKKGHLEFRLKGNKLDGAWFLIRTKKVSGTKNQWLLIKRTDAVSKSQASKIVFVEPQLALLVEKPPKGADWIHEIKLDGYRIQAHLANDGISLFTRKGLEWSEKFKGLLPSFRKLTKKSMVLDGEMISLDQGGHSHFQLLQKDIKTKNFDRMVYCAFDVLYYDGKDLRSEPLEKRKKILKTIFKNSKLSNIKMVDTFDTEGSALLKNACELGLEGIISKNRASIYRSGRYPEWTKSKCGQRQEFVIGGYTDPQGNRSKFGALLLGIYEKGKLRYCGRVGTGFDQKLLNDIFKKLQALDNQTSPFKLNAPKDKSLHFVKPQLMAEIAFANWTEDKHLRAAVFHGLRDAKPSQIKLSNPDKIFFEKEKISKKNVSDFYDRVAPFLLPHLDNRPLSIVRCPNGTSKACFFQKHDQKSAEWITVSTLDELKKRIQLGTIEFHPWGCKEPNLDRPDQIIMDLDPDDSVPWKKVVAAAFKLKAMLEDLHIKSYVKVTGGKGLHVQFAFEPIYSWDQIKIFAATLAHEMVSQDPKLFVDKMSKSLRKGKIFIDHFRNGKGSTAVAPYCLRARKDSAVALPVTWDELKTLKAANSFTLKKAEAWLKKRKKDPWANYFLDPQRIELLDQSEV